MLINDRWVLLDLLACGSGGRVWRAQDRATGQLVALKLVGVSSPHHAERVRREIRALRALQIEGVVRLLATGEHAHEPYIIMELVEGSPYPGRGVAPSWAGLAVPTKALLGVLARVHAMGFVHRDLKPANVLVSSTGRVTLLDFGLSRNAAEDLAVDDTGTDLAGTPRYLSPEQILGEPPDARSDLYALGVMLFESITGRPPYGEEAFWPRVLARHTPPPPPLKDVAPDVPPELARVVNQLLAIAPMDRPQSAQAVLIALQAVGATELRLRRQGPEAEGLPA